MENVEQSGYAAEVENTEVRLKWVTPNADAEIGHIARVSNSSATLEDPADRLIAYLLRKNHWSPFEMANMCVAVTTTRDISAQILRHRSFSFQEFSTRYADVEELKDWKECRFQDDKNRQNSWDLLQMRSRLDLDTPAGISASEMLYDASEWWDMHVKATAMGSMGLYKAARERGIAKEVARCLLPMGLCPTTIYMNGTIRSWIHYIALRGDPATQKEHRLVATGALELMRLHLPNTAKAFDRWDRTNRIKENLFSLLIDESREGEALDVISDGITDAYDFDTNATDFARAALKVIRLDVKEGIEDV